MPQMTAGYLLCATPRSGSTLLCDLLTGAGAGRPNSFYRQEDIAEWAEHWGLTLPTSDPGFPRAYLDAVRREGRGGTGVFGMRLMWESLGPLSEVLSEIFPHCDGDAARLEAAFGPLRYVHLSRQDRVAQAISRVRAEQSGLWHRSADGSERERLGPPKEPAYDAAHIASVLAEIDAAERGWQEWFSRHAILPVPLSYETLAADPAGTLARVLDALGLDPSAAAGLAPRTARLADAESAAWAARFRAEHG